LPTSASARRHHSAVQPAQAAAVSFDLSAVSAARSFFLDGPTDATDESGTADDIAECRRHQIMDDAVRRDHRRVKAGGRLRLRPAAMQRIKKYMLATEYSKPVATKAEIGSIKATILSMTERPAGPQALRLKNGDADAGAGSTMLRALPLAAAFTRVSCRPT
jgi:hypothetical protein